MQRKLTIGIILFMVGVGISVILEFYLRNVVMALFRWTTNGKIHFIDENICNFTSDIYYFGFGLSLSIFGINAATSNASNNLKNGVFWVGIFLIGLIGFGAFKANMEIVVCTNCENGIRELKHSELNYDIICGSCALLAGLPSFVMLIAKRKKKC